MMTKEEIGRALNPKYPGIYIPTKAPTKLVFSDGRVIVGYFQYTKESDNLQKINVYTFLEYEHAQDYKETKDMKFVTIVEGDKLIQVEYPSFFK